MKLALVAASFALIALGTPAPAGELRSCTVSARQNILSVCLGKTARNFSLWAKDINYCPIPPKKQAEQINYCPLPNT